MLSGHLPTVLGELTMLTRISLGDNLFVGTIPPSLAQLPFLKVFEVDHPVTQLALTE